MRDRCLGRWEVGETLDPVVVVDVIRAFSTAAYEPRLGGEYR